MPIPTIPSLTPPPSPPTCQQAVLACFTAKRALKKGSPQKKKAKTHPSSPSSDDMTTNTKETKWTWSNEDHTITRNSPPKNRSHRHLLLTSDIFDSDTDSNHKTIPYNLSGNDSEPDTSTLSPDDYSEERSNHATHQTPIQDTSQTFHDSHGNEYNTAQLYTSPSAFDPYYNEMHEDHNMDTNEPDQQHSEDNSLPPHLRPLLPASNTNPQVLALKAKTVKDDYMGRYSKRQRGNYRHQSIPGCGTSTRNSEDQATTPPKAAYP
jgi:hypothetical protein